MHWKGYKMEKEKVENKINSLKKNVKEWEEKRKKYLQKGKEAEENRKRTLAEIEILEKELIIIEHKSMNDLAKSLGTDGTMGLKEIIESHIELKELISEFVTERKTESIESNVLNKDDTN